MPQLHCYQYVNRPFEAVLGVLRHDAVGLFQRATVSAVKRAGSIASSLKIEVGGLEVAKEVEIRVLSSDAGTRPGGEPFARFQLEWRAKDSPGLFPTMRCELVAYPLTPHETQLELEGEYTPPLGALGSAADALVGHRIAEASTHRFLDEVVERIRVEAADG
jgi:hypothetical protein